MKAGDKIRFHETQYQWDAGNRVRKSQTKSEKITEGIVVCKEGIGWMVNVAGEDLPFFVTSSDLPGSLMKENCGRAKQCSVS